MHYNIGIDYSLNSPGIVITSEEEIKWISLTNGYKEKSKVFHHHTELNKLENFELVPYYRVTSKDYSENQVLAIQNADDLAKKIIKVLITEISVADTASVGMEGYSYGSSGNSLIDIVTYSAILRRQILQLPFVKDFIVIPPTKVKMKAGKGNYGKVEMFDAFIQWNDPTNKLYGDQFYCYTIKNLKEIKKPVKSGFNIKPPFTDLIDAYFITQILSQS